MAITLKAITADEARRLAAGDIVISPFTMPPWKPLRITEVYVPPDRQNAQAAGGTTMLRIHALAPFGRWLHATAFYRPPKRCFWDAGAVRVPGPHKWRHGSPNRPGAFVELRREPTLHEREDADATSADATHA